MPRGWRKLGTYPSKKAAMESAKLLRGHLKVSSEVARKYGSWNTKVDILIKRETVKINGKKIKSWGLFYKVSRKRKKKKGR